MASPTVSGSPAAPFALPPAPVTSPAAPAIVRRPSDATAALAARPTFEPIAPPAPVIDPRIAEEAALRKEIVKASAASGLLWGRGIVMGLLTAYPRVIGAMALILGAILVARGIQMKHYENGGGAILMGLGWIACEWIPVTRVRVRRIAAVVVLFAGILIEEGLKSAGVLR